MKRSLLALVAALLCAASVANAGDLVWERDWAVEPKHPLPDHLVFVVDVSSSMRGDPAGAAVREVATILSLFADDGWVRLYAFSTAGNLKRYDSGRWQKLPSLDVVEAVCAWFEELGVGGNTALGEAVTIALRETEGLEGGVAMIVVTDGDPDGGGEDDLAAIAAAQKQRLVDIAEARSGTIAPVPIHVIGIREQTGAPTPAGMVPHGIMPRPDPEPEPAIEFMAALARAHQGSCLIWSQREKKAY